MERLIVAYEQRKLTIKNRNSVTKGSLNNNFLFQCLSLDKAATLNQASFSVERRESQMWPQISHPSPSSYKNGPNENWYDYGSVFLNYHDQYVNSRGWLQLLVKVKNEIFETMEDLKGLGLWEKVTYYLKCGRPNRNKYWIILGGIISFFPSFLSISCFLLCIYMLYTFKKTVP